MHSDDIELLWIKGVIARWGRYLSGEDALFVRHTDKDGAPIWTFIGDGWSAIGGRAALAESGAVWLGGKPVKAEAYVKAWEAARKVAADLERGEGRRWFGFIEVDAAKIEKNREEEVAALSTARALCLVEEGERGQRIAFDLADREQARLWLGLLRLHDKSRGPALQDDPAARTVGTHAAPSEAPGEEGVAPGHNGIAHRIKAAITEQLGLMF